MRLGFGGFLLLLGVFLGIFFDDGGLFGGLGFVLCSLSRDGDKLLHVGQLSLDRLFVLLELFLEGF